MVLGAIGLVAVPMWNANNSGSDCPDTSYSRSGANCAP